MTSRAGGVIINSLLSPLTFFFVRAGALVSRADRHSVRDLGVVHGRIGLLSANEYSEAAMEGSGREWSMVWGLTPGRKRIAGVSREIASDRREE
jgi:hypothetical protein